MNTFVVDASVTLKWIFQDEIFVKEAIFLQKNYFEQSVNLIAPTLWTYETINGIKSAILKNKLVQISEFELKLTQLLESSPNLMDISDLLNLCLKHSLFYNISAYDSAYVTLAHAHGLTLITADEKLVTKINDPSLAISLSQYYNLTN